MVNALGWLFFFIIFVFILLSTKKNSYVRNFLLIAFLLRSIFVYIDNYLLALPDSQFDAKTFELTARDFSKKYGLLVFFDLLKQDSLLISRIISIFYTLFGENKIIAQSISVTLGTVSVYLVYYLCLLLWDQRSAQKAAWVAAIFPILALYSSQTFREPYIVFFLLLALINIAKFIIYKNFFSFIQAILSFYIITLFHAAAVMGGLVFLCYVIFNLITKQLINLNRFKINIFSFLFLVILFIPIILFLDHNLGFPYLGTFPNLTNLDHLQLVSNVGITDSAAYPSWLFVNNNYELFLKIIFKIFYFLYSPFLWDINQFNQILGFFDGMLYLGLTIYILCNLRSIWENPITRFFLLLLIIYIIVHALGVGNFGTAIRHRSKFLVFMIILAAPKLHRFIFSTKKKLYTK
jgi:4-amino-4-deoxy-L-arabinose transferase-like glycosyltransferase